LSGRLYFFFAAFLAGFLAAFFGAAFLVIFFFGAAFLADFLAAMFLPPFFQDKAKKVRTEIQVTPVQLERELKGIIRNEKSNP
jgi:hypothetical protein